MTEIILIAISGIVLYILADAALNAIESRHGEPIPHRSVIFFVIILIFALILFQFMQMAAS